MYRLQRDFKKADQLINGESSKLEYRSVSELAKIFTHETHHTNTPNAPTWVRLSVDETIPLVDQDDFRNELRTEHYPNNQIIWQIAVASGEIGNKKLAEWVPVGQLVVTKSITSKSCDQRLHFKHPAGS